MTFRVLGMNWKGISLKENHTGWFCSGSFQLEASWVSGPTRASNQIPVDESCFGYVERTLPEGASGSETAHTTACVKVGQPPVSATCFGDLFLQGFCRPG